MPVTRSKQPVKEEVSEEPETKRRKTNKKLCFEEVIRQGKCEEYSGTLPQSYIDSHTPEFIKGCHHVLKIDPSLYPVIIHEPFPAFKSAPIKPESAREYWRDLIKSVISQQVSGAAARSIESKFNSVFEGKPTPEATISHSYDELRAAGLSNMKTKYILDISKAFCDKDALLNNVEFYNSATSEELTSELIKLKGIAEWSAQMFEVFTLHRMSVFAGGDLGIARGMARYLQLRPKVMEAAKQVVHDDEQRKLKLKKKGKFANSKGKRDWVPVHDEYMLEVASQFAPFETVFMMVLWRLGSTNIDVLQA